MRQSSPTKTPGPEGSYFEVQAALGITKHMGGCKATEKLVELCRIGRDKYVLVVGCGVGVAPCYLAGKHGCRVAGIDISEEMVKRSKERAKREGVEDRVEFRTADAQHLPFEDDTFDAVICESVNAFISNRPGALSEYVRVAKPGGYVGLNEVTWLKEPPHDLVTYLHRIMGGEFLMVEGWKGLLEDLGLAEIETLVYKTNVISQWTSEVRQFELLDFTKVWCRYLCLLVRSSTARRFTREAMSFPKSMFRLFEYFGYGLYVGRKA